MEQDRITIQEASDRLKIGRKIIYRWIEKGLVSREREGNRAYVLFSEVKAQYEREYSGDHSGNTADVPGNIPGTQQGTFQGTNTVTVDRSHYDGLLVRLGQLESEKRYLLEYKAGIEAKDKNIAEAEKLLREKNWAMEQAGKKIQELQEEIKRLKRLPWWKRFFR